MEPRTPISLITGALGSGKTTLLKRILSRTGRRLAVLMNEFGEIAIDSRILPGENLRIIELAGGCVCCELAGEFEAAVNEIIERFQPEMIVVEATGVAEADALAYDVQDNLPQVRLDSVINIVDAYASVEHPEIGYAARSQLRQADLVLINKTDLVKQAAVETIKKQVRQHNDNAVLIECVLCDVDPRILFGPDVPHGERLRAPQPKQRLRSFTFTTDRMLDRAKFEESITALPAEVYRAKGFVRFDNRSYLFNYVAGRSELEEFPSDKTELVFIGPHLEGAKEAILARLHGCEV
jgi:G3E family GTPase